MQQCGGVISDSIVQVVRLHYRLGVVGCYIWKEMQLKIACVGEFVRLGSLTVYVKEEMLGVRHAMY